jgi:hypothetical protein
MREERRRHEAGSRYWGDMPYVERDQGNCRRKTHAKCDMNRRAVGRSQMHVAPKKAPECWSSADTARAPHQEKTQHQRLIVRHLVSIDDSTVSIG